MYNGLELNESLVKAKLEGADPSALGEDEHTLISLTVNIQRTRAHTRFNSPPPPLPSPPPPPPRVRGLTPETAAREAAMAREEAERRLAEVVERHAAKEAADEVILGVNHIYIYIYI